VVAFKALPEATNATGITPDFCDRSRKGGQSA
jgi:hypothetical protein